MLRKAVGVLFCAITICFIAYLANSIFKIPLNPKQKLYPSELSMEYYKGLFGGLYMRGARDCAGWLFSSCNSPDPFAFTRDRLINGADPNSFVFVGSYQKPFDWSSYSDIYKDKNHVIILDRIIPDGDPQTIQVFDGYAKDKNTVYIFGQELHNLDSATFENLGCGFYRDSANVYNIHNDSGRKPLDFVDVATFEMVDRKGAYCNLVPYVAKDKNSYYQEGADGVSVVRGQ